MQVGQSPGGEKRGVGHENTDPMLSTNSLQHTSISSPWGWGDGQKRPREGRWGTGW